MTSEAMPEFGDGELMMSNTLMIRVECREEFLSELRRIVPQARVLPACLALEVGEVAAQPGTFVLSERWRSGREYVEEVLRLDFYQRYLQRSEPLYSAPRKVVVLQAVV